MKLSLIFVALLGSAVAGKVWQPEQKEKFEAWKRQFKKKYASRNEEKRAMDSMLHNQNEIEVHNQRFRSGKETYERGLWIRSDLSLEEKLKILIGSKDFPGVANSSNLQASPKNTKAVPKTLNWVAQGLVHPVDDQEFCGACYAFATVGIIEGILLRKNRSTRISVQQIIDCNKSNDGCAGGDPLLSLKYAKINGLASASIYPYTSKDGECKKFSSVPMKVSSVSRQDLNGNENRLKGFVANYGPVAVAIYAADSLMNYKAGVYNNPRCSKRPNHAVLLVGYGTDGKYGDYWLVKNSWGSTWGERGYVRMARNKKNQCGIANSVWYAT